MHHDELQAIAKALSAHFKKTVMFTSCTAAGTGTHATGYRCTTKTGKELFIKKITADNKGLQQPSRKISALLTSHAMTGPEAHAVICTTKGKTTTLPDIDSTTQAYHVQTYHPGRTYLELLKERTKRQTLQADDRQEIKAIATFLAQLHQTPITASNEHYNDSLRSIIGHPELALTLLHAFPQDHPLLGPDQQGAYLHLMLKEMHRWKDHGKRLCKLHGDFWGANILVKDDKTINVIDYSRIPYGDPGIDVGWFLSHLLWKYYETNNTYYRSLGELFLKIYQEQTKDTLITKTMTLTIGLHGIIELTPLFYPNRKITARTKKYFAHITNILQRGEFAWD